MLSSKNLLHFSRRKAVKLFKKLAKTVPFYRQYLRKLNVHPSAVRTFDDFNNMVPVLDKKKLFEDNLHMITDIFSGHSLKECQSILPSSGFSGKLSFGITSRRDFKSQEKHVDMMLDYVFEVGRKKSLLINSLSMGIHVPAKKVVTVNTGPREDIVLELIEVFSEKFDQVIIVGDNWLIKNIIEKGVEGGIKWPARKIRLILGGDSFPENFRSYLAHLMGFNIENERKIVIGSSFGIAEIGLNILWETVGTIGMRRAASIDSEFRTSLLGQKEDLCPMLFQYHPLMVHVESVEGRLLFTNLNMDSRVPIIRYASGDLGIIIPYDRAADALSDAGLQRYIPRFKLPIVAVKERLQYLDFDGNLIFPNAIRKALYSDFLLPKITTGYFTIAESGKKLILDIQLKKGAHITDDIRKRFEAAVSLYVREVHFELTFHPYGEFRYGMVVDYERKFQHMRHRHT